MMQFRPDRFFHVHIPFAVGLKKLPLLRRMAGKVPRPAAVCFCGLAGDAEIPDQFLALLHLLLIQAKHPANILQRSW